MLSERTRGERLETVPGSTVLLLLIIGCSDGDAVRIDAGPPDAPLVLADARPPDAEVATLCDGFRFPPNPLSPKSCCQKGNATWHIVGSGPAEDRLAHRTYGTPCHLADGGTGCGVGTTTSCAYGPCAGKNEWNAAGDGGPNIIFVPRSDPTVCGWQIAGGESYPEPYTDQMKYPGVAATCPFAACLPNGRPVVFAFALAVTAVTSGASGSVSSAPVGISVTGAGMASWGYEGGTTVILTATPRGASARAVLAGGCSATGAYGMSAMCVVALDADKTVTVTYECQQGQTCEL